MESLTKDEKIKRIEILGGQYAPEMEPSLSIDDQLLICETLAENYFGSIKGGENMTADDWQEVESTLGEAWNYEETPELLGVLTEKRKDVGPNNSMMYMIQQEDGTEIGAWGSNVLDGKMKAVEVGEEIKIVYKGKVTSEKTKRSYHDFAVFHRPVPMKEV